MIGRLFKLKIENPKKDPFDLDPKKTPSKEAKTCAKGKTNL